MRYGSTRIRESLKQKRIKIGRRTVAEIMRKEGLRAIQPPKRLGYNDHHGYEVETHLGRYIGKMQWLVPFIGFDWRYRKMGIDEVETNMFGQRNTKDKRSILSAGVNYTLPMLVSAQAEIFTDGIIRFQLERMDIPVSKRLRMNLMVNTDKEYMAAIKYIFTRYAGVAAHYDSDMGFGCRIDFELLINERLALST